MQTFLVISFVGLNVEDEGIRTGEYGQSEEFAVSHALLVQKHACLRVNLLYSRLGLEHKKKTNI